MRRQEKPLPPDIEERLNQLASVLAGDPRVVFAYLFGGLARGKPTPLSDVDIAVYLHGHGDPAAAKLDLIGTITRFLATDEVDVVILNEAPLSLAGRIQQSARVLVDADPHRRHRYESLIRRQFCDFKLRERAVFDRRFGLGRNDGPVRFPLPSSSRIPRGNTGSTPG